MDDGDYPEAAMETTGSRQTPYVCYSSASSTATTQKLVRNVRSQAPNPINQNLHLNSISKRKWAPNTFTEFM